MKTKILSVKALFLATLLALVTAGVVRAQDMKQAADLYNEVATTFKQKPAGAVDKLNKCVSICEELATPEANDLKARAQSLIPQVHFQIAGALFTKGDLKTSINEMEKAQAAAEKINDKKMVDRINRVVPGIYYKHALNEQEAGNYEEAIRVGMKAISCNERFIDPWITVAQSHNSLKQYDQMLTSLEQGMEAAQRAHNVERQTDMRIMATNYLKGEADAAQKEKNYQKAVELLERAITFDGRDASIYQPLSVAYAALNKHDKVIEMADQAIECAPATLDKTQLYYLKAKAQQALGQNEAACASYKLSAHGQFKEDAEHQMKEVLKCK